MSLRILRRTFASAQDAMAADPLVARLTRRQMDEYIPKPQPYYTFVDPSWQLVNHHEPQDRRVAAAISNLRIITWNIDFMAPCPQARMASALAHLQGIIDSTPESTATVIMLQEMAQDGFLDLADLGRKVPPAWSNDLGQIAAASWVQKKFQVTDLTTDFWRCRYNGVILIDRRLALLHVARLPFVSEYNREAVFVDVALVEVEPSGKKTTAGGTPGVRGQGGRGASQRILRLCNVHLDSMAGKPPMRPIQWKACAKYLQDQSKSKNGGVVAGILAGDCNANQDYDVALPQQNGFKDAYLELGGKEDDPGGNTWGPQSKNTRFSHKRMDKVCFWQGGKEDQNFMRLTHLEKIGVGVTVEDEVASEELQARGYSYFVTDHYGLMADFELGKTWKFGTES